VRVVAVKRIMNINGKQLKPHTRLDSGRVRRFVLPHGKTRITQISTFCPDIVGPGAIHLYLIESDVLILMDTGIPTDFVKIFFYSWRKESISPEVRDLPSDYSEQQLLEGLKLAGYSIRDIDLLLISHGHPDHFLMGRSIKSQARLRTAAHVLDTPEICNHWGLLLNPLSIREKMRSTGMPLPIRSDGSLIRMFNQLSLDFSFEIDSPIFHDGPLHMDGSPIGGVQVKHILGHSPGSIGLIVGDEGKEKVLLCGDVLLYPITPHPTDLLLYLRTLEELSELEDISLVLPAHGKAITNLNARVEYLQRHHRKRLRLTYRACREPRSIWEIATTRNYFDVVVDPARFNPLAGTETLAHVELLSMAHGLFRSHIKGGVHYFQNSGEPFGDIYERVMELVKDRKVMSVLRY